MLFKACCKSILCAAHSVREVRRVSPTWSCAPLAIVWALKKIAEDNFNCKVWRRSPSRTPYTSPPSSLQALKTNQPNQPRTSTRTYIYISAQDREFFEDEGARTTWACNYVYRMMALFRHMSQEVNKKKHWCSEFWQVHLHILYHTVVSHWFSKL